jgi:putative DNA primase/helicase
VSLSKLGDGNHAVMMDGKLFNFCEEAPTYALNHASIFKTATGGEGLLTGYLKYRDNYQFKNTAKIVISCNEIPKSLDKTHALLRRLLIINFNRVFDGDADDKNIMGKLEAELPGIFNSMMTAYLVAKKRGSITTPKKSVQALKEYQLENDCILEFVEEELLVHPTYGDKEGIKKSELYFSYKVFHGNNGEGKVCGRNTFLRNLKAHIKDLSNRESVIKRGHVAERILLGIELKEKAQYLAED